MAICIQEPCLATCLLEAHSGETAGIAWQLIGPDSLSCCAALFSIVGGKEVAVQKWDGHHFRYFLEVHAAHPAASCSRSSTCQDVCRSMLGLHENTWLLVRQVFRRCTSASPAPLHAAGWL